LPQLRLKQLRCVIFAHCVDDEKVVLSADGAGKLISTRALQISQNVKTSAEIDVKLTERLVTTDL